MVADAGMYVIAGGDGGDDALGVAVAGGNKYGVAGLVPGDGGAGDIYAGDICLHRIGVVCGVLFGAA